MVKYRENYERYYSGIQKRQIAWWCWIYTNNLWPSDWPSPPPSFLFLPSACFFFFCNKQSTPPPILTQFNFLQQIRTPQHSGYVWQCGCGCFSNNFSCRNACQWCFFIFLKLFLTSAHQNDLKHTKHIKF